MGSKYMNTFSCLMMSFHELIDPSCQQDVAAAIDEEESLTNEIQKCQDEALASAIAEEEKLTKEIEEEESKEIIVETDEGESDLALSTVKPLIFMIILSKSVFKSDLFVRIFQPSSLICIIYLYFCSDYIFDFGVASSLAPHS